MSDDYDKLLDTLFASARTLRPDTAAVEEHFETRLLARMEEEQSGQALWSAWAWRLLPWFTTCAVIIGIGSAMYDPTRAGDPFAAFSSGYEESLTTSMLAGG